MVRNNANGAVVEQRGRGTIFPGGRLPSPSSEWALSEEQPQSNGSSPGAGRSPPPPDAELIDSEKAAAALAEMQEPWTKTVDASLELTSYAPSSAATAAAATAGVTLSSTSTVVYAESGQVYRPVFEEPDDYRRCLSKQLFGPAKLCSDRSTNRWSVDSVTVDSDSMDCEDIEDIPATFEQQQMSQHQSNGDHMCLVDACPVIPSSTIEGTETALRTETSEERVSITSCVEGTFPSLKEDDLDAASLSSPSQDASPNLRSRSCGKSNSRRRRPCGGEGGGVNKSASPVSHRLNPSESGEDEAVSNGDDGSGEDDEDDGE